MTLQAGVLLADITFEATGKTFERLHLVDPREFIFVVYALLFFNQFCSPPSGCMRSILVKTGPLRRGA